MVVSQAGSSNVTQTICEGQGVTIGNQTFTQQGNYTVTIQNQQGCDSTVNLTLNVNPIKRTDISRTICEGESVTIGNQTFSQQGNYSVTLQSAQNCDSIVNLTLTVIPSVRTFLEEVICEGQGVTVGNQTFTESGQYVVTLEAASGCDSIVTLILLVNPEVETDLSFTICPGQTVTVGGQTFGQTGNYTVILETSEGCDSIINLSLLVTDNIVVDLDIAVCTGQVVIIGDEVFDETGEYTILLEAVGAVTARSTLTCR